MSNTVTSGEQINTSRNRYFHLIESGWSQGVVFDARNVVHAFNGPSEVSGDIAINANRKLRESERLVLVSQDCDVVHPEEPYVEALICKKYNITNAKDAGYLDRIDRNSLREFLVDPFNGYVAQAKYRLQIDKACLPFLTPIPLAMDPERFARFVEWLARRYDRPAIPDHIRDAFHAPVNEVFKRLELHSVNIAETFDSAVHECRVTIVDSSSNPIQAAMVLLTRGDSGLLADQDDAINSVIEMINAELALKNGSILIGFEKIPYLEAPQIVFVRSHRLDLDYISFADENESALPPWREETLDGGTGALKD